MGVFLGSIVIASYGMVSLIILVTHGPPYPIWLFYICVPGALLLGVFLMYYFVEIFIEIFIEEAPKWLRSNWQKAGRIAQREM